MMRSRGSTREKPLSADEANGSGDPSLASPSKGDRSFEALQEAPQESGCGIQLPVIAILCLLLALTQYLLRSDNSQLKATKFIIQELQEQESRTLKQFPSLLKDDTPYDPNCERALRETKSQLANKRLESQNLERVVNEQHDQWARKQEQVKVLLTEKEQLETHMSNLHKEKRILAKRLGIKLDGEDADPSDSVAA